MSDQKKKSKRYLLAGYVWFAVLVVLIGIFPKMDEVAGGLIGWVGLILIIYGTALYAQSKGYSSYTWGLLAFLSCALAPLILAFLGDKSQPIGEGNERPDG